ncbi:retrotransposon protein, putative, ty1-copia subclass [Tanacetum coccineum]
MFLVYGGNPSTELRVECYCDAGFKTDRDDTKSQTGYVFILNGRAVDWKSSKQSTIAMSVTESEYIAASKAAMAAVWIRKFILGLGIVPTINEPMKMYYDNSAAVHYANEPRVQSGAKHYHRRYHYVCECVELGEIKILKVHSYNNLDDPFTKALSNRKLTQHARSMGLCPAIMVIEDDNVKNDDSSKKVIGTSCDLNFSFGDSLYLHLNDTGGSPIMTVKLTGTENYTIWSIVMTFALRNNNKLGFIDGSCTKDDSNPALANQ